MKKYKGLLISSVILIAIGLLGGISLGFFASVSNEGMPCCRFEQGMLSDIDRHFIEEMIPHHEDAIAMAELAITKAEHEEIRQLAANIQDSQSKEISDMTSWYKSWYATEVPESETFNMGMGMMDDMNDFKALEDAEIFDKEFIKQMIPHHQMAVMMASMLLNRTEYKEMQKLAQDIISTQTEEINKMSIWYSQWY